MFNIQNMFNTKPFLTNSSLLSVGQLCDNDCVAIFTKREMFIRKDGRVILQGKRNFIDGL